MISIQTCQEVQWDLLWSISTNLLRPWSWVLWTSAAFILCSLPLHLSYCVVWSKPIMHWSDFYCPLWKSSEESKKRVVGKFWLSASETNTWGGRFWICCSPDEHMERMWGETLSSSSGNIVLAACLFQISIWSIFVFSVGCRKTSHVYIRCIVLLWHLKSHDMFQLFFIKFWLSGRAFNIWPVPNNSFHCSSLQSGTQETKWEPGLKILQCLKMLGKWGRCNMLQM